MMPSTSDNPPWFQEEISYFKITKTELLTNGCSIRCGKIQTLRSNLCERDTVIVLQILNRQTELFDK